MTEKERKSPDVMILIVGVIIIAIVILFITNGFGFFSNASINGSSGQATSLSGNTYHSVILQGLSNGEQSCINEKPRGQSSTGCMLSNSEKKELLIEIFNIVDGMEKTCLTKLPRSKNENECKISSEALLELSERSSHCYDDSSVPISRCIKKKISYSIADGGLCADPYVFRYDMVSLCAYGRNT